ncbi:MAG: hypothetical protein HYU36_00405 [Planctomycetes bacterium]|nr:hypothetical protein [Planctomycetota bacterium]
MDSPIRGLVTLPSVVGLLALASGLVGVVQGEGPADTGETDQLKYAVVEVRDEEGKTSFEVMPWRNFEDWISVREEKSRRFRQEWKGLPREVREQTPKPKMARVKVVRNNVDGREAAEKLAAEELSKVPEEERVNPKDFKATRGVKNPASRTEK